MPLRGCGVKAVNSGKHHFCPFDLCHRISIREAESRTTTRYQLLRTTPVISVYICIAVATVYFGTALH
jgi:uncharacterized ParB-like nuclease family protein